MTIELGQTVRDKVTGYSGWATARCVYLGAATQIRIDRINTKGQGIHRWFPEIRLEVVEPGWR